MVGPVERTAQLPGDVLLALHATILVLTTISDLATFDETDYEFIDLEEEQEVLLALGNVGEGDIQPAITEHDRINFSMRNSLAREEAKV